MTTGPKLRLGSDLVPGLLAVALFAAMSLIVLNTGFTQMEGFPEMSVTAEIGYALFDMTALQTTEGAMAGTERFLAAFLLAAIVLDAALDASLVLAKREEEGETVTALSSTPTSSVSGASSGGRGAAADGGEDDSAETDGGDRA
ncbi:hypothetical protein ACYJ1Y_15335 [Natrialbaceae archaeon A-gly3]